MSVSTTLTLPSQPGTGTLTFIPLGGNGFTSPRSAQLVTVELDSDASGGTNKITVITDPRWENMIVWMAMELDSSTAAVDFQFGQLPRGAPLQAVMKHRGVTDFSALEGVDSAIWTPPSVPNISFFEVLTDNVDATETLALKAYILNFDINSTHTVPLHLLLANVPRISSSQP